MTADNLGGLLRGRGSHDGRDGDRAGEIGGIEDMVEGWDCPPNMTGMWLFRGPDR